MSNSIKIPITIYEIELKQFEKLDSRDTVGEIVRRIAIENPTLSEIKLSNQNFEGFDIQLYRLQKSYLPTWLKFVAPIISKEESARKFKNKIFSLIGFISYKKRIYAIAGGYGSFEVEQYTKPDFGLAIIVRLFDRDSRVIRSIQQRGVTGVVLGQTRYYRGDQRLSDENEFGQIFKHVQAELDHNHLINSFGFSKEDVKRRKSGCLAKSSFKINKAINFTELLQLISKIDGILAKKERFTLNKVFQLRGKRYEGLVKELNDALYLKVYHDYKAGEDPDFEICHSNFEPFLLAENYRLELNSKENVDFDQKPTWMEVVKAIRDSKSLYDKDEIDFKHSVLNKNLSTYDDMNNRLTSDNIFDHLNGELTHKGFPYFHIDKAWYKIDPTFIDDLNSQCQSVLDSSWEETLITHKFDIKKDEDVFNQSYLNLSGALVLDTVTPENIECCDILFYKSNLITFTHVKKGFSNNIRDLTSQISIAAKRIHETITSDLSYLEKVEKRAKKPVKIDPLRKAIAAQAFPANGIVDLFKQTPKPNITFCLAFVDTVKKNRSLKSDLKEFKSNIAKYSIIELANSLRLMNFGFKIVQIKK